MSEEEDSKCDDEELPSTGTYRDITYNEIRKESKKIHKDRKERKDEKKDKKRHR